MKRIKRTSKQKVWDSLKNKKMIKDIWKRKSSKRENFIYIKKIYKEQLNDREPNPG